MTTERDKNERAAGVEYSSYVVRKGSGSGSDSGSGVQRAVAVAYERAVAVFSDSDLEDDEVPDASVVTKFNEAVENLSKLAGVDKPPELSYQLNDLESVLPLKRTSV